ncbi:hypothetical protein O0I10_004423 [Lichtheimia ornata]|uniref:Uncharacterized protein n=1 Tax=Lichtheimia ornata TaxID=688661 RepID=A0AAD7V6P9_9FUNG|nr:uncharacterized protein O0I10_004423 [Lichtheimia ornata]KAJ8659830.1 hypothetical protein O0I10_004423 [Lichtheimia ornata]
MSWRLDVADEILFPVDDLVDREVVKETVDTSKDNRDLELDSQRMVLGLLEQHRQTSTMIKQELGGSQATLFY